MTKIDFNFILPITFILPIRHIENLECFEFGHSMECYDSVNKGRISTVPLLSE